MDFSSKIGFESTTEMVVTEKDTAKTYGSGLIEVFATPAMVAFMEYTAHSGIAEFLPEGQTTVGTEINVRHLKATPKGMKVRCTAKLVKQEGRAFEFFIEAWDEKAKIGEATHTRFLIDIQKFMDKISQ